MGDFSNIHESFLSFFLFLTFSWVLNWSFSYFCCLGWFWWLAFWGSLVYLQNRFLLRFFLLFFFLFLFLLFIFLLIIFFDYLHFWSVTFWSCSGHWLFRWSGLTSFIRWPVYFLLSIWSFLHSHLTIVWIVILNIHLFFLIIVIKDHSVISLGLFRTFLSSICFW